MSQTAPDPHPHRGGSRRNRRHRLPQGLDPRDRGPPAEGPWSTSPSRRGPPGAGAPPARGAHRRAGEPLPHAGARGRAPRRPPPLRPPPIPSAAEPRPQPDDLGPNPRRTPRAGRSGSGKVVSSTSTRYSRKDWGAKHGLTAARSPRSWPATQADAGEAPAGQPDQAHRPPDHPATGRAPTTRRLPRTSGARRPRALMTPEQFTQFEADKGAEWGSSFKPGPRSPEAQAKAHRFPRPDRFSRGG